MLLHLLCQHGSILHGMPHEEGNAEASAESGLWLCHTLLCTSHLHIRCIASALILLCLNARQGHAHENSCLVSNFWNQLAHSGVVLICLREQQRSA